jgi:hypothetical protein
VAAALLIRTDAGCSPARRARRHSVGRRHRCRRCGRPGRTARSDGLTPEVLQTLCAVWTGAGLKTNRLSTRPRAANPIC